MSRPERCGGCSGCLGYRPGGECYVQDEWDDEQAEVETRFAALEARVAAVEAALAALASLAVAHGGER